MSVRTALREAPARSLDCGFLDEVISVAAESAFPAASDFVRKVFAAPELLRNFFAYDVLGAIGNDPDVELVFMNHTMNWLAVAAGRQTARLVLCRNNLNSAIPRWRMDLVPQPADAGNCLKHFAAESDIEQVSEPFSLAPGSKFIAILGEYAFYQGAVANIYAERGVTAARRAISANPDPNALQNAAQLDYLQLSDLECEIAMVCALRHDLAAGTAVTVARLTGFALAATRALARLAAFCSAFSAYNRRPVILAGRAGHDHRLPEMHQLCAALGGHRGFAVLLSHQLGLGMRCAEKAVGDVA